MKLVIDIHKKDYQSILNSGQVPYGVVCAIMNGTPLPKGHGKLIECEPVYDKLIRSYRADEKDYPERGKDYRVGLSNAIDLLNKAPIIIEADKED